MHSWFDTVRATTSENTDRSPKRTHVANLARLEHISMVKNFVARRSGSKFHQDESSRVLRSYIAFRSLKSRSTQLLGNTIGGRMARTWICRNLQFGSPRSATHVARVTRCFHHSNQEARDHTHGRRKAIQKLVCTMTMKWQHLRHISCQDTGASWAEKYVLERKFKRTSKIWCHASRPTFLEDTTISKVHSKTRRFSSRPFWQPMHFVFTIEFVSGVIPENQVLSPRTMEDEEQIDFEPEQLTLTTQQKQRDNAISSRRLVRSNGETWE